MLKIYDSQSQYFFPLNEENLMATYQQISLELKTNFLSKFVKQGQEFDSQSSSFPITIFNPKVYFVVTMPSQILGLDNDRLVNEVILGF